MAKILLIDGSNYLFRAYHGLPDLRTSANEPTGAMKGFLGMLGKVWSLTKPDYAAIVFDAPGHNFRHERFPEYKANRPPMPDDLRVQIGPLREIVEKLGWPILSVSGVEADDVIATLAKRAEALGLDAVIATGDKDMAQLVNDRTVLLNTMNNKFYDREGVMEKYGVYPERIIDYLALMGDKVDNVPGIEKCGPKTAAKWIAEYGSLDGVVEHAPEVKGKIGENLRAGLPFLEDARALVTIKCDCEVPGVEDVRELLVKPADPEATAAFARRWEMSVSTLNRAAPGGLSFDAPSAQATLEDALKAAAVSTAFEEEKPAPRREASAFLEAGLPDEMLYEKILPDGWGKVLEALQAYTGESPVALSFLWEGTPDDADWVGVAFSLQPLVNYVLPLDLFDKAAFVETFGAWFASGSPKVIHDAKTALHYLGREGITVGGTLDDTMLMSYVLEAHLPHDEGKLAARRLGRLLPARESIFGKGAKRRPARDFFEDGDHLWRLLAEEVGCLRALWSVLAGELADDERLETIYQTIERPLLRVLYRMEENGVDIDVKRLAEQSAELTLRIDELENQAHELAGHPFNLASPMQLSQVLFEEMGLPAKKKTATGGHSTNEEVLTELAYDYPLPKIILEHRRLTKLRGTYLDKLPKMVSARDGRVHTTFGQATAVTGRLTSVDPNLQNIPVRTEEGRRVREAFIAKPGSFIVSADYSQIELRIMAHLSGDEGLLAAFARGEDIHRATAAEVFGRKVEDVTPDERRMAKVINFGLIYGMSEFGLARNLGLDRKVAKAYIDKYFTRYQGVKRYMERMRSEAHERGFVETEFGRRLWLPDIESNRAPVRQAAERAAINAPMQGTAADLIKLAMCRVAEWLEKDGLVSKLILQVHDELILEVPEEEKAVVMEKLPAIMAGVAQLRVPLLAEVGVGANWGEAH